MTTKTQLAMFAVAALTIGGFAISPVFAASHIDNLSMTAPATGTDADSETNSNLCGAGESVYSSAWVQVSPEKIIEVTADAEDCTSHTQTDILVKVNGNTILDTNTNDDKKTWQINHGALAANDSVTVKLTYHY